MSCLQNGVATSNLEVEISVINHQRSTKNSLPICDSRNNRDLFSQIKNKILNKLSRWQEKLFSSAGKEILIKAVVQSIPTYTTSCFKLSSSLCNDIESLMAKFYWGYSEKGSKIHWKSWKFMCRPKSDFNQALLAKQAWRNLHYPDSLLAKVFKARYFPRSSILKANIGYNPSLVWRSIRWGSELLQQGIRWRVRWWLKHNFLLLWSMDTLFNQFQPPY